jgi:alkylation response protein AidB-like acyl-CoA dehydrogenase
MIDFKVKQMLTYDEFLSNYKETLKKVFYERDNIEKFSQKRGFPSLVFREIMANQPLSVAIPTEFGGRGCHVKECLGLLAASSYESLPLSLTFGINIALFLEPLAKYGHKNIKPKIYKRFLEKQNMGGLMITEPDYGSDALNMQTSNVKIGDEYHIQGIKHWQGLTGLADYWIMTCRNKNQDGKLSRDLDFFICDEQADGQQIVVEELFNNLGLYQIPYGRNKVDIKVPEENKLIPETTGLKLMMDLLHRSRFQFAGMGMGFLQRMLDEAIEHCTNRFVGGKPLLALDQVKFQISKLQSAFTICSGMCYRSAAYSGVENNLAGDMVEANSIKAYLTDLMQASAQTLVQLCGAKGYLLENFGARGIIDSRPFQIFEGSNEMLYTQIGEAVLKLMKRGKMTNFYEFLKQYPLTSRAVEHFSNSLNFTVEGPLPQRKILDLGKVISRIVSAQQVIDLGAKGFRPDLINDCLLNLKHDVSQLLCSYSNHNTVEPKIEYLDNSSWLSF